MHGATDLASAQLSTFNTLEDQRMDDANHARTLEEYAALLKPAPRAQALFAAEAAWRAGGNHAGELRVLREIRGLADAPQTDERYFELLLRSNPSALVVENTDASANYVLAHADGAKGDALAYRAVDARARQHKPVWGPATTALAGLFFADTSPKVDAAFHIVLGDMTIAERLKRLDPDREIIGKSWFDYGMRYGVYRGLVWPNSGDAEDYLAAGIEGYPGSSASFVTLAGAYADARKPDAALAEFDHALELTDDGASIHIAKAELLWSADRRLQALDEWKRSLKELRRLVDTRAVPESFWIDFASVASDLRQRGLGVQFKPELEAVLRPYIVKNGYYRSGELLHSALIAVSKPVVADAISETDFLSSDEASAGWIVGLAEASSDHQSLLSELCSEIWFPRERLGPVYARRLQLAAANPAALGADVENNYEVDQIRQEYLRWLIERDKFGEADRVYGAIPKMSRGKAGLPGLMVLLRARQGKVSELIASFEADPTGAPALKTIAAVADALRREAGSETERGRNQDAARELREYVFARRLALNELAAPDYLALAQSRLESPAAKPDVSGALELLHRMTMLPGDLYRNLDSAADLLTRSGRGAEALPFLEVLADAHPWVPEYRLRLAREKLATGQNSDSAQAELAALAQNGDSDYRLRAQAAEALRAAPGTHGFASAELTLLASRSITPAQADRPYFVRARELAAADAPVAARPGILLAAMGFEPAERLRLAVFRAEVVADENERALAAVQPLLIDNRGYGYRYGAGARLYSDQPADQSETDDGSFSAQPERDAEAPEESGAAYGAVDESAGGASIYMPASLASEREKLMFALDVAKVQERLGHDGEATTWLQTAAERTADTGEKTALAKRLVAARERLRVARENAARRPVVQAPLDQAVLVRPRVSAAAGGQP